MMLVARFSGLSSHLALQDSVTFFLPNEVQPSCLFLTVAFCVIVILFLASLTSVAELAGMCFAGSADSN